MNPLMAPCKGESSTNRMRGLTTLRIVLGGIADSMWLSMETQYPSGCPCSSRTFPPLGEGTGRPTRRTLSPHCRKAFEGGGRGRRRVLHSSKQRGATMADHTVTAARHETDVFADLKPPLSLDQALVEAHRCLYCYDAPCTRACPTHIDVPEFIRRIGTRNLKGSAQVIMASNPLGASCARVCPTEVLCEGACVFNDLDMPAIDIGRLQRFATDQAMYAGTHVLDVAAEKRSGSVAVIGAGPAGLACASQMARLGYKAVVYDAAPEPGGLNRYGVAPYKLTNQDARAEVAWLQAMTGFEIKSGVHVGVDVTFAQLEAEHDFVFLAVGLGGTRKLGIPGEDLAGVIGATEFIEGLRSRPLEQTRVGRHVAVIGAGNTAIDAATEASRLGAESVHIVYRRGPGEMPCYPFEYHLALQDRVRFVWHAQPVAIQGNGKVSALKLQRMRGGDPDEKGRPRPVPIPDSEFELEVDMVIKASGQQTQDALLGAIPGLVLRHGKVVVDASGQTGNPRYYAGGDCVSGGKEVVNAAAEGKAAAQAMHQRLTETVKEVQ